jgi:hypothetical protein
MDVIAKRDQAANRRARDIYMLLSDGKPLPTRKRTHAKTLTSKLPVVFDTVTGKNKIRIIRLGVALARLQLDDTTMHIPCAPLCPAVMKLESIAVDTLHHALALAMLWPDHLVVTHFQGLETILTGNTSITTMNLCLDIIATYWRNTMTTSLLSVTSCILKRWMKPTTPRFYTDGHALRSLKLMLGIHASVTRNFSPEKPSFVLSALQMIIHAPGGMVLEVARQATWVVEYTSTDIISLTERDLALARLHKDEARVKLLDDTTYIPKLAFTRSDLVNAAVSRLVGMTEYWKDPFEIKPLIKNCLGISPMQSSVRQQQIKGMLDIGVMRFSSVRYYNMKRRMRLPMLPDDPYLVVAQAFVIICELYCPKSTSCVTLFPVDLWRSLFEFLRLPIKFDL